MKMSLVELEVPRNNAGVSLRLVRPGPSGSAGSRHEPPADRQRPRLALARAHEEVGGVAVAAAQESPRPELVALAFHGRPAVAEVGELPDGADTAAPPPRRARVLTQLVAVHAQRQVRLDVLDG